MKEKFFPIYFIALFTVIAFLINCKPTQKLNKQSSAKIENASEVKTAMSPSPSFLAISDIHLMLGEKYQKDVHHAWGDSGEDLWDSSVKEIKTILEPENSKPNFLIVLGDLPYHIDDSLNDSIKVRNSFYSVYKSLLELSNKNKVPLIIAPGNNDGYGGDYHWLDLASHINYNKANISLFNNCYINSIEDTTNQNLGFYSVYPLGPNSKLKVIVLNTVIFTKANLKKYPKFVYHTDTLKQHNDASKQIAWLEQELEKADSSTEKVLIAMHIPPGIDGFQSYDYKTKHHIDSNIRMWNDTLIENNFIRLINKHQNIIIGSLASHTHMDGIRLFMNDTITSLLISVPGIAPGHGNNPAFKLINYDPTLNFALTNFNTYYMDNKGDSSIVGLWKKKPIDFVNMYNINTSTLLQYFKEKDIKKASDLNIIQDMVNNIYSINANQVNYHQQIDSSIFIKSSVKDN